MNQEIETVFNAHLTTSIAGFENLLNVAFPHTDLYFIGYDQHLLMLNIVTLARDLSYNIQHNFVCCRLFVTIGPNPEPLSNIYGTYAFGLNRIMGTDCKVLIEPTLITKPLLESFLSN